MPAASSFEHRLAGPIDTAGQLGHHLHAGIGQRLTKIGGEQVALQLHGARLVHIANDDLAKHELAPGPRRQPLRLLDQQLGDAAAHRAAAQKCNAVRVHGRLTPRREQETPPDMFLRIIRRIGAGWV